MRNKKAALLLVLAAVLLAVTGCYVPEDTSGSQRPQSTVQNFQTVAPTASPTPVPTPVPTPTQTPVQTPVPGSPQGTDWTPATPNPAVPETWAPPTEPPVVTPPMTAPVTPTPYVPIPSPTPEILKRGTSDATGVRRLQERLKNLGYYTGSVDGDFGEATEAAVKAFQRANRLNADGIAGARTLDVLYSTSAVRITPTPRVTATPRPTATPRTNLYLQSGSRGRDVTALQNRLMTLGYLSGAANSSYGGATEYAVKAFQKRAGLWEDGKAGPDTLTRLYADSAPRARRLAATVGEALYEGESGDSVSAMQRRLKELGYLSGSADGKYGSGTKDAVMRFQAVNGLTANGTATTATLNRLYAETAIAASGVPEETGSQIAVNSGSSVVQQGMSSGDVKQIQTRLKELGYYSGRIDGNYGNETVTAVMAFQLSRGLTVDGKVGPKTLAALNDTSASVSYKSLRQGSSGKEVRNVQYTLYELGYYSGAVDGKYGASTASAVSAFQSRNGLPATGEADSKTQAVLYSSGAKEAPASKGKYKTLRPGDTGEDVLEMKDVLIQLGYQTTEDNHYDAATEAAVRLFQERNGLKVDGIAGSSTLTVLYSDNPVPNN